MNKKLIPWLRGIATSLIVMLVYAVPLGFLMALVLLVIAMEEGGATMSSFTVPLTQAIVLLSQGVGFHAGPIVVTVVPLLLTFLLIALIRTVFHRMGADPRGYVTGLITWLVLDGLLERNLTVALSDSTFAVLGKGALVFTLGFLWAYVHEADRLAPLLGYIRAHVSQPILHVIAVGVRLGLLIVGIVLLFGFGTVIAWIVLGHHAVGSAFDAMHIQTGSRILICVMAAAWLPNLMLWAFGTVIAWIVLGHHAVGSAFDAMHIQTGSRILICVMAAAWLPNLMLWASAWLFGAGFSIGDLATYTLGEGSAARLPDFPIFHLFPQPVADPTIRMCMTLIPLAIGCILGLLVLTAKRGFGLRPFGKNVGEDPHTVILAYAYPVGAFCITSIVVSLMCTVLYALSNGALGTKHLASAGVDVRFATNVTARPCALGLFLVWGIMLLLTAIVLVVRMCVARHSATVADGATPQTVTSHEGTGRDASPEKKPFAARVVNSTPQPKGEAR